MLTEDEILNQVLDILGKLRKIKALYMECNDIGAYLNENGVYNSPPSKDVLKHYNELVELKDWIKEKMSRL